MNVGMREDHLLEQDSLIEQAVNLGPKASPLIITARAGAKFM
jgi:hypothetical protein